MARIGLLFASDENFPTELARRIAELGQKDNIESEPCAIDIWRSDEPKRYDVVLDGLSSVVPFYRTVLQQMVLSGTTVINNPYWMDMNERFFASSVVAKTGVNVPKTAVIPSKWMPPGTSSETFTNLKYQLSWDDLFGYVGFPAYLKLMQVGGTKDVFSISNAAEFYNAYDQTSTNLMLLQEAVPFDEYYRCYCIGKMDVRVMAYDPHKQEAMRFIDAPYKASEKLADEMRAAAIKICQTLGHDFTTVDFAVKDGVPYAIDMGNPAPKVNREHLGEENYNWVIEHLASFLIDKAKAVSKKKKSTAKSPQTWRTAILS